MPNHLVSVVMPAYNHQQFIGDAIDSVLNQTYSNLELVIINDGSTDKTEEIILAYDDPRIKYTLQENQDAYNALNAGIQQATGDYIAIINSDDIFTLDRLETLVLLQQDNHYDFLFSDVEPIDAQNNGLSQSTHPWNSWHEKNRLYYAEENDLYRGFLHGNFMVTTSNIFMTRELQEKVGNFAAIRYLHDYDFVFRILRNTNRAFYVYNQKLLKYRIHDGNTLSEAAIIGREQDQDIIRQYTLKLIEPEMRSRIETGINRLIALEHELVGVKNQLKQQQLKQKPYIRPSIPRRIYRKIRHFLTN